MVKLLSRWRVLDLAIAGVLATVSLPAVAGAQGAGAPTGEWELIRYREEAG